MKNILVVSPFFMYPANHGGKIDIFNSLKQLRDAKLTGHIDLLYADFTKAKMADEAYIKEDLCIRNLIYMPLKKQSLIRFIHMFSILPDFALLYKGLKNIKLPESKYDFVLIHSLFVDSIMYNNQLCNAKFYLRVHNDEYVFRQAELKHNHLSCIKWVFNKFDSWKLLFRQQKTFKKVDKLLFISSLEYDKFSSKIRDKSYFLPTYYTPNKALPLDYKTRKNIVVFIGGLARGFNADGLKWYLVNVHSRLKLVNPHYKFFISGNSHGGDLAWLYELINNDEKIGLFLDQADLSCLYESAAVFVNPIFSGGGLKIKTIEATVNMLPIVSTSTGVSGSGLVHQQHCLVANNADDFVFSVSMLLRDRDLGFKLIEAALLHVKKMYSNLDLIRTLFN